MKADDNEEEEEDRDHEKADSETHPDEQVNASLWIRGRVVKALK